MDTPKKVAGGGGALGVKAEAEEAAWADPVFLYKPRVGVGGGGRPPRRNCCREHCGCLGACCLLVTAIVAVAGVVVYVCTRPHAPAYELLDAAVSALSLRPVTAAAAAQSPSPSPMASPLEELGASKRVRFGMARLALKLRNRSAVARLAYRRARLEAGYGYGRYGDGRAAVRLRAMEVAAFSQRARGERVLEFAVPVGVVVVADAGVARNLTLDFERGTVTLRFRAPLRVGVTVLGFLALPPLRAPLSCFVNVRVEMASDVVTVNSKGCL